MLETIEGIKAVVKMAESMRNSYFWNPPASARERRKYEDTHSVQRVEWQEGNHAYTAEFNVSCSCHYVYAKGYYTKDGNRTTLTTIKNSLKRLEGYV